MKNESEYQRYRDYNKNADKRFPSQTRQLKQSCWEPHRQFGYTSINTL